MATTKKLLVPVVALMLCAVAVIGVGYAYQGTYSDSAETASMDVHWVKAGSSAQIAIDTSTYKVDVDTVSTLSGTTYAFSATQSHGGVYDSAAKTVTFSNVKIGTLNFEKSTNGASTGTLSITLSGNTGNVSVSLHTGTPTMFTVGTAVDVNVDIVIAEAAISSGASTVTTPAFTMNVTATVTEASS